MTIFYDTIFFLYCCSYNGLNVDQKNEKTGPQSTILYCTSDSSMDLILQNTIRQTFE